MSTSIFYSNSSEISEPGNRTSDILFDFPTADKPLICKLLRDPFTGESCVKLDYHKHMVGNTDKDTRRHVSRDSLGLGKSPETDYFWELISQLKELKDQGKKDTDEYKEVVRIKKFFTPSSRGYLYFVQPNSSKITALPVGPMVFNRLFGRKATDWAGAIPSLIKEMQAKNLTPYLDRDKTVNSKGWIKIWRTGEGLATQYHMELCTVPKEVVIEGETVTVHAPETLTLHSDLQAIADGEKELDMSTFPDVRAFEKNQVWSLEESEALVAHDGSLAGTPERLLKTDAGTDVDSTSVNSTNYETNAVGSSGFASKDAAPTMDDIPF